MSVLLMCATPLSSSPRRAMSSTMVMSFASACLLETNLSRLPVRDLDTAIRRQSLPIGGECELLANELSKLLPGGVIPQADRSATGLRKHAAVRRECQTIEHPAK